MNNKSVKIFTNIEGYVKIRKTLDEVIRGYSWGFETLSPHLHVSPAILVAAEQEQEIKKILGKEGLLRKWRY